MTNLLQKTMAGHKESNRPRLIGEVILDSLVSNSPLAVAFRERKGMDIVKHLNADGYGKE